MKTRIEKEKIENIVTVKRKHLCIKRVNSYFTRYTIIKKIKCLIKLIAFITILIICFVVVNNVTKRKYSYKKMADFFSQKKNFDVLFFGSSHTINGVYPMQLWNDYGIISYNMGNHSETIVTTYYNLLLALKHIKPSINDKIRMYEKSKITIYKHTFFFVYFLGRYTKIKKLITQLRILKEMNLKPNYSALA